MPKKMAIGLMILLLVIGTVGGVLAGSFLLASVIAPTGVRGEQQIGALLPLSGDLKTFGENSRASIRLAATDVNAYLASAQAPWSIKILEEDTGTDATKALQAANNLLAKGVSFMVGPQASSELRNLVTFSRDNKVLLISQSSTAPDLGVANDLIYRFAPNDTIQGPAIGRAVYDAGVRRAVWVYRDDPWGNGLAPTSRDAFKKLGGVVHDENDPIKYNPTTVKTAGVTGELTLLNSKVGAAISAESSDATRVGVVFLAFEESVLFLDGSQQNPTTYSNLHAVKWFGSDGTVQSGDIVNDAEAATFARARDFINPIFAPTSSDKFKSVRQRLLDPNVLGREVETYAYGAYDAVWVTALAMQTVGRYDGEAAGRVLKSTAEALFGATGWITLNAAGDRAIADYDLWEVEYETGKSDCNVAAGPPVDPNCQWKLVATYIYATDSIQRVA